LYCWTRARCMGDQRCGVTNKQGQRQRRKGVCRRAATALRRVFAG
jgi:hypothetical protein